MISLLYYCPNTVGCVAPSWVYALAALGVYAYQVTPAPRVSCVSCCQACAVVSLAHSRAHNRSSTTSTADRPDGPARRPRWASSSTTAATHSSCPYAGLLPQPTHNHSPHYCDFSDAFRFVLFGFVFVCFVFIIILLILMLMFAVRWGVDVQRHAPGSVDRVGRLLGHGHALLHGPLGRVRTHLRPPRALRVVSCVSCRVSCGI